MFRQLTCQQNDGIVLKGELHGSSANGDLLRHCAGTRTESNATRSTAEDGSGDRCAGDAIERRSLYDNVQTEIVDDSPKSKVISIIGSEETIAAPSGQMSEVAKFCKVKIYK